MSEILVSSVAYNMAGDENPRNNYLKSLVVGNVLSNSKASLSDVLQSGYKNSPGLRLKNFFRWANLHYTTVSDTFEVSSTAITANYAAIVAALPPHSGESITINSVAYGGVNYNYWAVQEVYAADIYMWFDSYTYAYEQDTQQILLTITSAVTSEIIEYRFTPVNLVYGEDYIYIHYTINPYGAGDPIPRVWIYRVGSGHPEIDILINSATGDVNGFFPSVPIRWDNAFIDNGDFETEYALSKKAYKKAVGGDLDEIIEKLADNEDLDDIDFAYIMFGTSLNVKDNSCRKYIYRFFHNLLSGTLWENPFNVDAIAYRAAVDAWEAWAAAQLDPSSILYGSPEPTIPPQPLDTTNPLKRLLVSGQGGIELRLDIRLYWNSFEQSFGSGLKKPDAKSGEVWIEMEADIGTDQVFSIHWQYTSGHWQSIRVIGLRHENWVYRDKAVTLYPRDAFTLVDDVEELGFIIPLHYGTLKQMGVVDLTQMAVACAYVVVNCYVIVKKPWYATTLFQIFIFVAIVAIAIATGGAGAGASIGLLGSAASVGAAVGLTGFLAVLAGTLINMLAAMILMQIIAAVGTAIFGAKLGAIISAVVSIVAITFGAGLMNGQSMSSIFSGLTSASSLISMTSAVGNGVAGYVNAASAETLGQAQSMLQDYNKQSSKASELFAQNIGHDMGQINPMSLTDMSIGNSLESSSTFLTRTLLTGSDIADISMNMLSNFADITLSTDMSFQGGD